MDPEGPGGRQRLAGVSLADVRGWDTPSPQGKWAGFFAGLAARADIVGVVEPQVAGARRLAALAAAFHPSTAKWRERADLSPRAFRDCSRAAGAGLDALDGEFDAVVQLQTMCAPWDGPPRRPYVIYTDTTFALTRREWPAGAPLAGRAARRWADLERRVAQGAAAVLPMSEWAGRSFVEDYGCDPARVVAIGAGCNELVAEASPPPETPTALFVGVELPRKGGDDVLAAWPAVRSEVPDARLVIVGPRNRPSDLPDGVEWLGRVDRARLDTLYREATIFVMPSRYEPWGFVFHEAMGHARPCVAARACAMPEIIDDGRTGLLVDRGDVPGLAAAMATLLGDQDRAAAMGRAAFDEVHDRHRWTDVAERLLKNLPRKT